MYKKRKRTNTDASVDTEKIKKIIKKKLVAEMQMQNSLLKRLCCHQCPITQALHPPH
jgi:hypothetical protein